jgi:sugar fermentation stimulation protein A
MTRMRGDAPHVAFSSPLIPGQFVRRLNRFAALVRVAGREEHVHVRNSGRLRELLTPGRRVLLEIADREGRRTRFTLALVRLAHGYVSADAHLPNALVEAALRTGGVPGFRGARLLRREPAMGRKRADFLVTHGGRHCLVEVKSVTLVVEGVARFPDAPTARGRAHLEHLMAARRRGLGAVVLFVIQRCDALAFAPNHGTDPLFAVALRRAARAGVCVRAMVCRVTRRGVWLDRSVPVRLTPGSWPVGTSCLVPESS